MKRFLFGLMGMVMGSGAWAEFPIDENMCDTYRSFLMDLRNAYEMGSLEIDLRTVEDFIDDRCGSSYVHLYDNEHPLFKKWCYDVFFMSTAEDHKHARLFMEEIINHKVFSENSIFYNSFCPCMEGRTMAIDGERYVFTCDECTAGTYYDSLTATCKACPDGGTSPVGGASSITECYKIEGGTDETGTWTYADKCYYSL